MSEIEPEISKNDNDIRLSPKKLAFCQYYLESGNGTESAIKAGYSKRSAHAQASALLKNPNVKAFIDRAFHKAAEKAEVTAERIIEELSAIGFSKISDFLEVTEVKKRKPGRGAAYTKVQTMNIFPTESIDKVKIRAVSEIKMTKDGMSLKVHDKISALEKIAKMLGYIQDRVDIMSGGNSIVPITGAKIIVDGPNDQATA